MRIRMFIPISDDNPAFRPPIVTVAIIAICVLVYLHDLTLSGREQEIRVLGFGMIPAVLFGSSELAPGIPTLNPWLTVFTSMFMHGGFMHLAGNMVYLWVFGNNIEDTMGHARFIVFYLLCGIAAAMSQALVDPDSVIPMVGASGAISGVLGAYLVLHPHARVKVLFFYGLVTTFELPASAVLGWWIVVQVINLLMSDPSQGGVAWYAHIGGFLAGMALIFFFRQRVIQPVGWDRGGRRRGPWG
jgi:membrane associated rhomboid family serine protease